MDEPAVKTKDGIRQFRTQSGWRVCYHCGIPITPENYSGWDTITNTPGLTAPQCMDCHEKLRDAARRQAKMKITRHARRRLKSRLGIDGPAVERIAAAAWKDGQRQEDLRGEIRNYVRRKRESHRCGNLRVYRGHIYVFVGNVLVTVYWIPEKLK